MENLVSDLVILEPSSLTRPPNFGNVLESKGIVSNRVGGIIYGVYQCSTHNIDGAFYKQCGPC
jgi:hypothetical protein